MRSNHFLPGFVLGLTVTLMVGCSASQRIIVQSEPCGAEVYLQRRGDVDLSGQVVGITGTMQQEQYHEDYFLLGTTPVDYVFPLEETESSVIVPGLGSAAQQREYREGTLRIQMEGYQTVERAVRFTGSDLQMTINLTPVEEEAQPETSAEPAEPSTETVAEPPAAPSEEGTGEVMQSEEQGADDPGDK